MTLKSGPRPTSSSSSSKSSDSGGGGGGGAKRRARSSGFSHHNDDFRYVAVSAEYIYIYTKYLVPDALGYICIPIQQCTGIIVPVYSMSMHMCARACSAITMLASDAIAVTARSMYSVYTSHLTLECTEYIITSYIFLDAYQR